MKKVLPFAIVAALLLFAPKTAARPKNNKASAKAQHKKRLPIAQSSPVSEDSPKREALAPKKEIPPPRPEAQKRPPAGAQTPKPPPPPKPAAPPPASAEPSAQELARQDSAWAMWDLARSGGASVTQAREAAKNEYRKAGGKDPAFLTLLDNTHAD